MEQRPLRYSERKLYSKPPANTRRVERTLKLIKLLNGDARTVEEIAKHIDISPRSVYRYIGMLTSLGFKVEYNRRYTLKYRIANVAEYFTNDVIGD